MELLFTGLSLSSITNNTEFILGTPGFPNSHSSSPTVKYSLLSLSLSTFCSSLSIIISSLESSPPAIHKKRIGGFPGGAVVENLPANAGDTGSSPGLGRSHMPRSNYARKPQLLSLRVWSLCSTTREAAIVRGPRTAMKSGPHLPQLDKALAQKRRPNTANK